MSPVARTDIVACADIEPTGRSKKSVYRANISALFTPAENERLIVRVGQPTTTADSSLNIRGERVVGDSGWWLTWKTADRPESLSFHC